MSNYYAGQVASVLEDFVTDVVAGAIDYDEVAREVNGFLDAGSIVENGTYGSDVTDWFDMSGYVTEDDLDERIDNALDSRTTTADDVIKRLDKIEATLRLIATAADKIREPELNAADPFAPYVGGTD